MQCVCVLSCSVVLDCFVTLWIIACQAPLSMGFSSHEYWSVLPFPSPGDLPNPGIKVASPALAGEFFTTKPPRKRGSKNEDVRALEPTSRCRMWLDWGLDALNMQSHHAMDSPQ